MSFGKLYAVSDNSRSIGLLSVAKLNNLDVELVDSRGAAGVTPEVEKLNALKQIPVFEQADGFTLTESLAIAVYFASQNEKTILLGKSKQEYAQILKWMSLGTSTLLPALGSWFRPLTGLDPYNKKSVETSQAKTILVISVLEKHLANTTYLVGERISLADYYVAGIVSRGFQYVFDAPFRTANPNFTRWWATIANQEHYTGKFAFIEEAVQYTPPAKAPKPSQAPKAAPAPKPKVAEPEDDEEEDKPAPKPKHPLEALPKATLILDDWKRKYSNSDTRTDALPWFWTEFKPEEYSLWKLDYKYNDELTKVFMTSNLIGGFFTRLEASRKYIFGAASVYGEADDSIIKGAFLIRGDDEKAAFDVAPDYESYEFTKLDPTSEEDKEFVNSMWAWDQPIIVNGKEYKHADGKVFK